jgi:hypothetical protein
MKPNPLDQFFDTSNFEILDAGKDKKPSDDNSGRNRIFEIEIVGPIRLVRGTLSGWR